MIISIISTIAMITLFFLILGINIIRPTERGLIERLGKYTGFAKPGFKFVIPIIERLIKVNITERMADARRQEIITKDNLNAIVDAQVYYKIKSDEESVISSQYNAEDVDNQIVSIARTTLRNILGSMSLKDANCNRDKINNDLKNILGKETASWGIDIVRTELKEIQPPNDVQETMNRIVKAENEKDAAKDFALAEQTKADGARMAKIKLAEGLSQSIILEAKANAERVKLEAEANAEKINVEAKAKAEAIKSVNVAVENTFTDKAKLLRCIEATEACLRDNSKIILPEGKSLVNVIGDLSSNKIVPIIEED